MITIRRLRSGESDLFRQIRLASLQEAPYAFSATYDSALQRSAESWHEQAESTTHGSDRATFIAFSEDLPIGMTALYRREGQEGLGEILQVWVSPEHRGTSVTWDLMDAVFEWARQNHFRRLLAGVTRGNDRAIKFYTKYGFSLTDEFSPDDPGGVYLLKEVQ